MRRNILLVLALLVSTLLPAATVSKDEARQKALQFLTQRKGSDFASRRAQSLQLADGLSVSQLYVFNIGQQEGFVVVSGDDCTGDAILGYADKGSIDTAHMPDNLRSWLQGYADDIQWMQQNGIRNDASTQRAVSRRSIAKSAVSPMLSSKWDQGSPYNTYCPEYAPGYHCPTGCLATAMAQVMYYHGRMLGQSTTTSAVIKGYTKGYTVSDKPVRTFDWTKMADTYPSDEEANEEVARLMEYVGAGVQMSYSESGSGASLSSTPGVLSGYFGYDSDICEVSRNDYQYADWIDLLYTELTTNGPIMFGGQSTSGGHAFVLEGYDSDDYFYINWGWSGTSDGLFKLSVCYPEEQGIGGSSSQTGYNRAQSAVINVNPVDDGIDLSCRMTAYRAWTTATEVSRTTSGDFTQFGLYSEMYNMTGSTATFDFGFGLYQDGKLLQVLLKSTGVSLDPNYGYSAYGDYVTFGAGLEDGEYQLIPISRQNGSETWLPDFDADKYYVVATISGNTMTLTEQTVTVDLSAKLALSSTTVALGNSVTVTATVTNNGTLYSGDILLVENNTSVASKQIELAAGAIKDYELTYTPTATGDFTLSLIDKNYDVIASKNITVTEAATARGALTYSDVTITGGTAREESSRTVYDFYGNSFSGTVTMSNSSTTSHSEGIYIMLWQYSSGTIYSYLNSVFYDTSSNPIVKGTPAEIPFQFDNLTVGTSYLLTFRYADMGDNIKDSNLEYRTKLYSLYGVTQYLSDGQTTIVAPTASVTVDDQALALDLTNVSGVTSVTPNSNPNTLYYVGGEVPSGLDDCNVIQNGTIASLTLTDGYNFYAPTSFTATSASFTRQFSVGADGSNGWSTLVLPFDVTSVTQGDKTIDWFHSSTDTGKNFWVKEFTSDNGTAVNFDFADDIYANTPYIVAVPGNTWGEKWNLTGKDITFVGSGPISASPGLSTSGGTYKFVGEFQSAAVSDCYLLNNEGNSFEKTSSTVSPFRAYFAPLSLLITPQVLAIGSEQNTTGITELKPQPTDSPAIYTLDGRKVSTLRKGINIVNGKKIVK